MVDEKRTTIPPRSPGFTGLGLRNETLEEPTVSDARLSDMVVPLEDAPATLVVLSGEQEGRKFLVDAEAIIGRDGAAAVHIPDSRVSRSHAVLKPFTGGGFEIQDLTSRNGTFVNGLPVETQVLQFGDRIQIGRHTLLFTLHDPLQDQVLQRQKLAVLGQLGAGIAHDFNNLLGAALSTLDYLETLTPDKRIGDPDVRECFVDIRTASERATELTRRLLRFTRQDVAEHRDVSLTHLCAEVLNLLRRTFDQSIDLKGSIAPKLFVRGHRGELHQLMMNLCVNARDAMPQGGRLTVTAKLGDLGDVIGQEQVQSRATPIPRPEKLVMLTVSDTGTGMDEVTKQRLFEPFFTTKTKRAGTGLGLALASDIITAHGGSVYVDSAPGEGTTFHVWLPALVGADAKRAVSSTKKMPALWVGERSPDRARRILVVDDEELIRRSFSRLLSQAGYEVTLAVDGFEAVKLFEQAPQDLPDLVLLDIDMPGLDGVATLERIRKIAPRVMVISVSGHADSTTAEKLRKLNIVQLVEKPFDTRDLLTLIETCMI